MTAGPASSGAEREHRRHRLVFAALYLCEGAPIGFLWWALPTILRERGVSLDRIGALTSWLVLPWALKFLWAPGLDAGGGRTLRRWIVGAQLVMAVSLLPLAFLGSGRVSGWILATLVLHAVAAASQDAAIDSLAIRTTPPEERGRINGWMQLGMLLGRSLFGGGALFARRWIGDAGVVLVLAGGLVAAALALALRGPRSPARSAPQPERREPVGRSLLAALRRPVTWLGLLFAATAGAGFEAVGVLAGPLLIDRGVGAQAVGVFLGLPVVAAMALGALLGGRASDRLGIRRTVLVAALGMGAAVLALALLAETADPAALFATLSAVYLGIGCFTASSYALFMELTDPALGATQFSAYMGATNLCESWSARLGGTLAAQRGYSSAFTLPALAGLAALALLPLLWPDRDRGAGVHSAA